MEILGSETYDVMFVTASGRTQALVTVRAPQVRDLGDLDLITVRSLAQSVS